MKLKLIGHDERYTVEQSLLALFPEERPVYGEVLSEDARWAVIRLEESAAAEGTLCRATTELGWDGRACPAVQETVLTGSDYDREGQRRHCIAFSVFLAARELTGVTPPWGSLTGVRPGKLAAKELQTGADAAQAQRYLEEHYYVSPRRARLAVEGAQAGLAARADLQENDIALYLGIPFCPTRCAYCSFVSNSVERSFDLVEPYLEALEQEVRAGGELVRSLGLRVRAFYMGGGTPTTLTAPQMDRLLGILRDSFDLSACPEITVEAGRPDTVTPEKLAVLRRRGVTRVSVNPQTMEDHVLSAIGRRHTAQEIRRAMGEVAEAGFDHVNMDLIAGLPEDTPEGFRRSLDECIGFGADNLTVHTLSLKKGSGILTRGLAIPGAEDVAAMLDYADPTLRSAGYAPYYLYRQKYMSGSFENVGWCMDGAENLYNIYIMEELCSILSLGAGGSTKMVDARRGRIARAFNLKYPKEYTATPEKWQANQAAFAAFYREREN